MADERNLLLRVEGNAEGAKRALREIADGLDRLDGRHVAVDVEVNTKRAREEIRRLKDELASEKGAKVKVDAETGTARAKLEAVRVEADRLDRKDVKVDVRVDDHGALSKLKGIETGGLSAGKALVGVGLAVGPQIVGSLGQAAVGAGALGVAAAGAGVAFGALGLAAKSALTQGAKNSKAVTTAQLALNKAEATGTKAAIKSAQARLDYARKVAGAQAGLAKSVIDGAHGIKKAYVDALGPGVQQLFHGLVSAMGTVKGALPGLSGPFKTLGTSIRTALSSPETKRGLEALIRGFGQVAKATGPLVGPLLRGIINLGRVFFNIAKAAMPSLVKEVTKLADWLGKVVGKTGNLGHMHQIIQKLVREFDRWVKFAGDLIKAAAPLFTGNAAAGIQPLLLIVVKLVAAFASLLNTLGPLGRLIATGIGLALLANKFQALGGALGLVGKGVKLLAIQFGLLKVAEEGAVAGGLLGKFGGLAGILAKAKGALGLGGAAAGAAGAAAGEAGGVAAAGTAAATAGGKIGRLASIARTAGGALKYLGPVGIIAGVGLSHLGDTARVTAGDAVKLHARFLGLITKSRELGPAGFKAAAGFKELKKQYVEAAAKSSSVQGVAKQGLAVLRQTEREVTQRFAPAVRRLGRTFTEMRGHVFGSVKAIFGAVKTNMAGIRDTIGLRTHQGAQLMSRNIGAGIGATVKSLRAGKVSAGSALAGIEQLMRTRTHAGASAVVDNMNAAIRGIRKAMQSGRVGVQAGTQAIHNVMVSTLGKAGAKSRQVMAGTFSTIVGMVRRLSPEFGGAGRAAGEGLARGIEAGGGRAKAAAAALAQEITSTLKNVMQVFSPSRVTHGFGRNVAEGLALGMLSAKGKVGAAAGKLGKTATGLDAAKGAAQTALASKGGGFRGVLIRALDAIRGLLKDIRHLLHGGPGGGGSYGGGGGGGYGGGGGSGSLVPAVRAAVRRVAARTAAVAAAKRGVTAADDALTAADATSAQRKSELLGTSAPAADRWRAIVAAQNAETARGVADRNALEAHARLAAAEAQLKAAQKAEVAAKKHAAWEAAQARRLLAARVQAAKAQIKQHAIDLRQRSVRLARQAARGLSAQANVGLHGPVGHVTHTRAPAPRPHAAVHEHHHYSAHVTVQALHPGDPEVQRKVAHFVTEAMRRQTPHPPTRGRKR